MIPYYSGDIYDSVCKGHITFKQFMKANKKPSENISTLLKRVNTASKKGNKTLKNELKKSLVYFTPSVEIEIGKKRQYKNIVKFTGYAQIDVDGLDIETATDLKNYFWNNYNQFACVYLSPSGNGVKGLMRIPIVQNVKEYKEYFQGIETEFDWIDGWDSTPKNAVLPLYISEDPMLLHRENAIIWTKKGVLPDQSKYENLTSNKPAYEPVIGDSSVYKSAAYYEKITLDIFDKRINDIIDGDGHPRLRSACLVLGSRVGAGYLTEAEAIGYALHIINSNNYLKIKIKTYERTLKWGIFEGIKNPKYYN